MVQLGADDIAAIVSFRRELHRFPEVSGEEAATATRIIDFLARLSPDRVLSGMGGHGVAAVFDGDAEGPTVLIRSETDALPILELSDLPHASTIRGKAHLCGHDGHTATLLAVATVLSRHRPRSGRVVLMFQPAEETGAGAAAVLADARFAEIAPDLAFSLHNLPGLPFGQAAVDVGPANCASRGLKVTFTGKTAHASMPETGTSPMAAMARLMPALTALGTGLPLDDRFAMATVTHASMGEKAFGIAPAHAEIWVTLRTVRDQQMDALCEKAESLAEAAAKEFGLGLLLDYHDIFLNCENDAECVRHLRTAMDQEGIRHMATGLPIRASEDFGRFGKTAKAAMFFFGAGENHPQLHNPDYDFPDGLIEPGARIFLRTISNILG